MPFPWNHVNTSVDNTQIDAIDVTGPDDSLDLAIGDLTTLITTDKTDAVHALNEVKSQSNTNTSGLSGLTTRVNVSLNSSTGKINTGAIDTPGMFANDVIDSVAISPTAFGVPNLIQDGLNEWIPPDLTQERGRLIWNPRNATVLPLTFQIISDPSNPYSGGKTMRMLGSSSSLVGGRFINCRTAGLKVGDKVTGAIRFKASGSTWTLSMRGYTAAGAVIAGDTVVSNSAAATGSEQLLKAPTYTVVAGADFVLLYFSHPAGAPDADIYAMWANKGNKAMDFPGVPVDWGWFWQEIVDARAGSNSLSDRLNQSGGNTFGRNFLQQWNAKTADIKLAVPNTKVKVGFLGDSWEQRTEIKTPFRTAMQTIWGNGGYGWVNADSTLGGAYNDTWTYSRVGTWADANINTDPTSVGPAGSHAFTTDIATPAKISWTLTGNTATIHYWKIPSGGDFEWRTTYNASVSGWTTVSTADPIEQAATTTFATPGSAFPTLVELRAKIAGSGIKITGIEFQNTGSGLVFYGLGNGGTTVAEWLTMNSTKFQASLAALQLDVIVTILGTNDKTANVTPASFQADIQTLIGRFRSALPLVDVILVSAAENGETGKAYTMGDYDKSLRTAASLTRSGYISGWSSFDIYNDNSTRGVQDPVGVGAGRHLTDKGGRIYASMITDFMRVGA